MISESVRSLIQEIVKRKIEKRPGVIFQSIKQGKVTVEGEAVTPDSDVTITPDSAIEINPE